jgi:hypothetical protein
MQKSIPCNEQDWWDFKKLALANKMHIKDYFHTVVQRMIVEETCKDST